MENAYKIFRESIKEVTRYYMLLVEETKSQRLVGSTNEWVLDNYYMISEQEKVLRGELKGVVSGKGRLTGRRIETLWKLLEAYLRRCHHHVDKNLLFRYLSQVQVSQKDYLTYPEVCALLPLTKTILIKELADLCRQLEASNAYHYSPTDNKQADRAHLDKAAQQNLQMMNIFNSLKKMTKLPIAELLDAVSFSEKALKAEKAGMYDQMYDKTKDDYRAKIVRFQRSGKWKTESGKRMSEYELVKALVAKADEKGEHVGWQLFPPKKWNARAHWYVWIVVLASALVATVFSFWMSKFQFHWVNILLAALLWVPMSQVVIDLFNWLLGKLHKPRGTFKIKFKDGLIPDEYATMVIMPTILKNKAKVEELLGTLEVYYLSNINRGEGKVGMQELQNSHHSSQNLYYTLVGDAASYKEEDAPWDQEVVDAGLAKVKELNEKYGAPIFNFVYRKRAWSEGEQTWLGYERKRGAILHFNDLVLGQTSEEEKEKRFRCETISEWLKKANGFTGQDKSPIQFIITLDTDTELVLYSAQKLIGAMAHPLNRAQLSDDGRRVNSGYGIMQPRVNVDVEVTNKSRYAQLFAGLGGLDVYTTASFELYQDIFNEGSFCGKGIYDLRVFQQVLKGTFPENLILSHDLIEGCHIRCGLINDLELFDDNPSNYIDDAKRHHRWTRGDWQIIAWLKNTVRNEKGEKVKNQVNAIGKWKIFDNLRRSVLSLGVVVMVLTGYIWYASLPAEHPVISPAWHVLAALIVVACPIVFFILGQVTKLPSFGRRYRYYMTLMRGFKVIIYRSLVPLAGAVRAAAERGVDVHRRAGARLLPHVVLPPRPAGMDYQRRGCQEHQRNPGRLYRKILVQLCVFSGAGGADYRQQPRAYLGLGRRHVLRGSLVRGTIPDVLAGQEIPAKQEEPQRERDCGGAPVGRGHMAFLRQPHQRGKQLAHPRQLPAEPREQDRLQDLADEHRLFPHRRGQRRQTGIHHRKRGCGPPVADGLHHRPTRQMERSPLQLVQRQDPEGIAQLLHLHLRFGQLRGLPVCGERIPERAKNQEL